MAKNISAITINTTRERVWDTLTKPELVKRWQYGSKLETTWEIGSRIEFTTEWNGTIFRQWGTILEFNPMNSLKYDLFAPRPDLEDKPENYFIMEYLLTATADAVELKIIQHDNRPGAIQEEPQGAENPVLQMLKKTAEEAL